MYFNYAISVFCCANINFIKTKNLTYNRLFFFIALLISNLIIEFKRSLHNTTNVTNISSQLFSKISYFSKSAHNIEFPKNRSKSKLGLSLEIRQLLDSSCKMYVRASIGEFASLVIPVGLRYLCQLIILQRKLLGCVTFRCIPAVLCSELDHSYTRRFSFRIVFRKSVFNC